MTNEQFDNLRRGDIVRGRVSGTAYVIDSNIGHGYIGVNTVLLTHADEWEYCTPKSAELAATDSQQLQAKIAAKTKQLHEYYQPSEQFSRDAVITMLRQLSAVQ